MNQDKAVARPAPAPYLALALQTACHAVNLCPDVASARRFWDSAEYAEVKRLRDGTGQFEVRLLEGPAPAALSTDRST